MKYNNDVYSTTIGANSFNSGALASVTGVFSIASSKYDGEKKYKSYAVQNTGATIYGSMNSIESATSDAEYSGIASSVLGFANKTQNANAALIWGTGNEVTNSIESIDIDYNGWNKLSVAEAQQKAIEAMQSSKYAGGSVMAIGGGNKADYAKYSQLTGVQNKVTGTKAKAAKYDFVNGYQNTVTNASDVTAIGIKNEVTADGNKVIGDNHKVSGKDNVIFGSADKVTETTVNNAVVLGHNAKVTSEGSVALGSGSVADRANAVSVGRRDANRQIINVAAGTKDTDAVNVSQLRDATANANKGWKLSTEGGAANQVASEATVDFSGKKDAGNHQNITVSNDGNNVKIDLASELHNVTGVVNGKSRVALGTGVAGITNGQASVVMLNGSTQINGVVGIDNTGKISGVANGEADTDAVNYGQLKDVEAEAKKHTQVKAGTNVGIVPDETEDGTHVYTVNADGTTVSGDSNVVVTAGEKDVNNVTNYGVKLNKDLKGIESISNNTSKLVLREGWAGMQNGVGASVFMVGGLTTINGKVTVDEQGKISGVAAGINNNDAVNVGQLNKVSEIANKGWNLATNGVVTEATNVKPGDFVDFSGDKNISVSHDGTKVKVELNKDIDVNSVQTNALNSKYNLSVGTMAENGIMPFFVNSTGDFYAAHNKFHVDKDGKVTATAGEIGNVVLQNGVYTGHSALRDGELFVGDASGNYSQITTKGAKLGKVTVAADGKISGVAAGAVTADSTDAVNGSQLHAVATEAGKHSKVVNGSNINVEETDLDGQKVYKVNLNKDIMLGDLTGKNVSISGTNGTIEATGAIATKDRVYADKGAKLADIDVTGDTISNGDAKLALNGAAGTAGMINGKGASVYMQDGYTVINSKVAFDQNGKISGVAAGAVTADSTDAVNGSQLHAVATEAGKHSKVVSGNNINVEETDVDGQKFYKVNMNKDIMLGDLTGKNVSISGTNGTIEATGAIATNDRVHADKGAKLADIDVTGNKISNGASSIVLDGSNVKVNDKVTIDQDGKISGVAAGEVSKTSTDAINGSQLNQTNENVAALDKRVTQNEEDIAQNKADIAQNKADIAQNKADIAQNKTDIKNLDNRVTNVEELAKKHTTVTAGDNIAVTESTNKDGGKEYKVALDKDINLDSVTTGQIVMNNDGLKVGKDVSVTATAVTAGKTSISDEGVKVGDKTYISDKGLNANDQKVTNVAAGELSATSKDAVNGSQLYETNQAIANNATNISSLSHSISNLDNRVNKVGAGAAALAALHPLDFDPDAKWDFAAGYGNYRGANAAAVGAYYRPNEDTMFSVGGTFGNGENMVNAGVSFKLGSGSSHVSTSRVAMAKEIKELRGELEAMKSAMLDANAGKKIDTSKLQLFPDVPQNHWAYEYVAQLAGNGMIEGYPDGNFAGDRPMTRYEFAAILYRAMTKGAVLSDKILSEFSHELEYFTVDTIAKDKAGNPTIQRVRTVKENKNK